MLLTIQALYTAPWPLLRNAQMKGSKPTFIVVNGATDDSNGLHTTALVLRNYFSLRAALPAYEWNITFRPILSSSVKRTAQKKARGLGVVTPQ